MELIPRLSLIAVIPVIVSIILYFVLKIPGHNRMPYMAKQIIIGIVFGGLSILGTEFGVLVNGATINARDAAPLCAALIFGAPAGIIAGLIGGVERWFAVYWGAGMYTRLACSISTALVGIFGAILKRYMFENKIPKWIYAVEIGVIGEVFHMMMVFVTHMDDVETAFSVVKICTVPMIVVNSVAVGLAVLALSILDKDNIYEKKGRQVSISEQIQKGLLALLIFAFILTAQFTYRLQDEIALNDAYNQLNKNVEDIKADIDRESDENLLNITRAIKSEVENAEITDELLVELAQTYNVADINIVDRNGYIINSNIRDFIGYDMNSSSQSALFMDLFEDEEEIVEPYQSIGYDDNIYRKYAGIAINDDKFIQVGYNAEEFQDDIASEVVNSATYRHIGTTGGLFVVDSNGIVVSSSNGITGLSIRSVMEGYDVDDEEGVLHEAKMDDEDYYYLIIRPEGYTITAFISQDEVNLSREISTYVNAFLLVVVFAGLFILIYSMIEVLIVRNFRKVNGSLAEITNGNLDTSINIKTNDEFITLSQGINTTVDAMKGWIDEANKRIDNELAYAKQIQFASLPTTFPAFPERDEFDIYASMTPAKEVGGDFYDFYIINGDTLAFLVADVSGKGIPAALFMMKAKSIIKNYAEYGIAVNDILTNANFNLCEGNDAGMFVTCFIAFLNLRTGELKYSNAGHNRPLIKHKDGTYEYLKAPNGFILGGMEGIAYKEQTIQFEPGDEIFMYTDGVVEATNADKELYGDDRLKDMLNSLDNVSAEEICHKVKEDVDQFYVGCPQFDDITILSLKFKKFMNNKI